MAGKPAAGVVKMNLSRRISLLYLFEVNVISFIYFLTLRFFMALIGGAGSLLLLLHFRLKILYLVPHLFRCAENGNNEIKNEPDRQVCHYRPKDIGQHRA